MARAVIPAIPPSHLPAWCSQDRNFFGDEDYLLAGARYVELNPVRAKLVKRAAEDVENTCPSTEEVILDDGGNDGCLFKVDGLLRKISRTKCTRNKNHKIKRLSPQRAQRAQRKSRENQNINILTSSVYSVV